MKKTLLMKVEIEELSGGMFRVKCPYYGGFEALGATLQIAMGNLQRNLNYTVEDRKSNKKDPLPNGAFDGLIIEGAFISTIV